MGVMSDALEKKLKEALSLLSLEDCILQECSGLHEIALFFILEQILPFSFIFHFLVRESLSVVIMVPLPAGPLSAPAPASTGRGKALTVRLCSRCQVQLRHTACSLPPYAQSG